MDKKELIHLLEADIRTSIRLLVWLWSVEHDLEDKIKEQFDWEEYDVYTNLTEAAMNYDFGDVDLSKGVEAFVDMLIEDAKEE